MAPMDRQEPEKEIEGLAALSIEDKAGGDPPSRPDSLPPPPVGLEQAPPEPRPAPSNGAFPYAAYSGQPRPVGPHGIAPRQLPPYVCTTSPGKAATPKAAARGDAPGSGGSSTGWGGMPLSSHGPPSPASGGAFSGGDLPSSLTDKEGALGPASGGASAEGTASEPGDAGEGAPSASPRAPRRRPSRGAGPRSPCAFFLKTGSCAYGDRCKFEHPYDKAPKVVYNSMGLPMRPEEPPCSFYMKHAHCAFGHTCKYHHPELGPGAGAGAVSAAAAPPPPGASGHHSPPTMVAFAQGPAAMAHPYYAAAAMQYQQLAAGRLPDSAAMPHPMAFAFYRGGVPGGAYPSGMGHHQLPPGTVYAYGPAPGGMMGPPGRDGGGSRRAGQQQRGGGGRAAYATSRPSPPVQSRQDSGSSPFGSPRAPRDGSATAPSAAMGLPVYTPKPLMVFNSPGKSDLAAAESD